MLDLVPAFLANGWKVQVMLPNEGEYSARLRALNCQVTDLHLAPLSNRQKTFTGRSAYLISVLRITGQLQRVLGAWRPDLLYVNGPRVLPAAAWISRRERIPLIFHAHHRIAEPSALRITQSSLNAARASVIACCSYVAYSYSPRVPQSRIRVIYNGVSDQKQLSIRTASPATNVGIIGRIDPEKGQLDFVLAARQVAHRFPHIQFHVIGSPQLSLSGYADRVRKESEGLPICFHGWRDDMANVLRSLDLLVVSSPYTEATPRVILEAFSAGVPVLAYALGGIPEIIDDNWTGFLTKPTPEALASRMVEVLETDVDLLHLLAQRARSVWQERFHIDRWREVVCDYVTAAVRPSSVALGAKQSQVTT